MNQGQIMHFRVYSEMHLNIYSAIIGPSFPMSKSKMDFTGSFYIKKGQKCDSANFYCKKP